MQLSFYGAAGTVTGSCHLLRAGGLRILVDCGLFQGGQALEARNADPFPFNPAEIDYVLLTHAHIDHSGRLPLLHRAGFRGAVVATRATVDLLSVMLVDSAHIQEADAEWMSRKRLRAGQPPVEPLYRIADALAVCQRLRGVDYGEEVELGDEVTVRFVDAGHILGSASLRVRAQGRAIAFSGDVGRSGRPILRDPQPVDAADVLVLESTYGDREHADRDADVSAVAEIVRYVHGSGGKLIIPAFAVGRTQELLYYLHELERRKVIPSLPIFIDSPLAQEATDIMRRHPECYDEQAQAALLSGEDPFGFASVRYLRTAEESMALNHERGPAIVIAAAGMAQAGRVRHHLKHCLWRPECAVALIGYQAEGTLGRALAGGARRVRLFGEEVSVRARVVSLHGFSAHADRAGLLSWCNALPAPPQETFLVHGEPEAAGALAVRLREEAGWTVDVARDGETIEIDGVVRRPAPAVPASAPAVVAPEAPSAPAGRAQIAALETWTRLEEELALLEDAAARARADLAAGRTAWAAKWLARDAGALDRITAVREALQGR